MRLAEIFRDFVNLFIPSKCLCCGLSLLKYETNICKGCLSKLPKTNFYKQRNNPVSQVFWGRVNLENAFSYYYFTKGGNLQKLIHEIKYHGAKELAYQLGWEFGIELKNEGIQYGFDMIVPVPLHKTKEKRRGYNQSGWIAQGLSDALELPMDESLLKRQNFTSTQTQKTRQQRWENVKDAFEINDTNKARNKHLLLVDDVITTGATLEACAQKLLEIESVKLSVVSLAYACD